MDDLSVVVRELRLARDALGWSREQAAEKMNVSASLIEKVETGKVPPSPSFAEAAARVLVPAEGLFTRLREDGLKRPVVGEWLRDWLQIEQQAEVIRWFEPALVPGLLQVEGYVRALMRREAAVAARLERQLILQRDEPPDVVAIVDESVLSRRVGDPSVMR